MSMGGAFSVSAEDQFPCLLKTPIFSPLGIASERTPLDKTSNHLPSWVTEYRVQPAVSMMIYCQLMSGVMDDRPFSDLSCNHLSISHS